MMLAPLVETTRGVAAAQGRTENVHYGSIAVVDASGRLIYGLGDTEALCFTRSTLKPLQALPLVLDGGLEKFQFGSEELALMCASHSGQARHVELAKRMLSQIGCNDQDLQCGTHVPLHFAASSEEPPVQAQWSTLQNNCSGKHCGFLAWCRLHDVATPSYLDTGHPLQERIAALVAEIAAMKVGTAPVGLDGCSAPNYAIPLQRLAQFYARIVAGSADPRYGGAFESIFQAMTHHPALISGPGRCDLAIMSTAPGDWISKAGADGVQVFASRTAQIGIAIKIADGAARAVQVAMVAALGQLGLLKHRSAALLEPWQQPVLRNHRGLETGAVVPSFKLSASRARSF